MDLREIDAIDMAGDFPFGPVQELAEADSAIGRWLAEGTIGQTLHRTNTPGAIHRAHEVSSSCSRW